jgi:hypothetical protein
MNSSSLGYKQLNSPLIAFLEMLLKTSMMVVIRDYFLV